MNKPTITLFLCETKRSDQIETYLNQFGKTNLVDILSDVIRALRKCDVVYDNRCSPECKSILETIKSKNNVSFKKAELVKLYACFAADIRNIKAVADAAMPEMNELWKVGILQTSVSKQEIKKILRRDVKAVKTNSWNPKFATEVMTAPFEIESNYYFYSWRDIDIDNLFLPQCERKEAADLFIGPEINNPPLLKELPEGLYRVENFAQYIDTDIMFLMGIHYSNELKSSTGSITQSRINMVSKKLKSPDFTYNCGNHTLDRKAMLILAFAKFVESEQPDQHSSVKDFALFVANNFGQSLVSTDFQIMLPYYKGFTKTFSGYNRANQINKLIVKLLAPAGDGWLDMKDFICRYLCNDNLISKNSAYTGLFNPSDFKRFAKLRKADSSASSTSHISADLWSDITRPYIVHYIKLLCGVGILEIAVDPNAPESDAMEGIRYVRLAPLGRYAYGLTDEYKGASLNIKDNFDLDQDALIVTVLDKDSPYILFLEQIGRKIGSNRFHVTAKSIVSRSNNKIEAQNYLENFQRIVCPEPKGIWAEMIAEAQKRIAPNLPISDNYMLERLDTKVPGLSDLILNNAEIRKNIIIAQDGYLLIKRTFVDKFKFMLKSAGYMT